MPIFHRIILVIVFSLATLSYSDTVKTESVSTNRNISEWTELASLFNQYQTKYTLINVWASWCLPCKKEMPILYKFDQNNHQWNILYVNIDQQKDKAISFLNQSNLKIHDQVWFDPKLTLMRNLKIRGVPSSIAVDKDGYIISTVNGDFSESSLEEFTSVIEKNEVS